MDHLEHIMNSNEAHKTAIARTKLSAPAQYLTERGLLVGRVLDFGCGHGVDAEILSTFSIEGLTHREDGIFEVCKWDPFFHPNAQLPLELAGKVDTIMCNYVLNVVTPKEQEGILWAIHHLLRPYDYRKPYETPGRAYITVRRDMAAADMSRQRLVKLDLPVVTENAGFCIYETWK
jgi:hypothetical protein